MNLNVQLFAVARDWAGRDQIPLELPADATVERLRRELDRVVPRLAESGVRFRIAVNDEFAADHQQLHENDSIALIPPVSGG
ncbi:MAG: MoaD/ThiS family protein [Pirellulales bacterium]